MAAWVAARLPGWDAAGGIQITPDRRASWQRRFRDRPGWAAEWRGLVARLGRSAKARGEDAKFPRGVRLDDFLRQPDYPARINEGEFDDPRAGPPPKPGRGTGADLIRAKLEAAKAAAGGGK